MYTASIYFLGQYRPAYFEAETARKAADKAIRAINEVTGPDYGWLAARLNEACGKVKANCTSWSAEHGCRGVSLVARAHDPFLDGVTRDFPAYPGLDYSACSNR